MVKPKVIELRPRHQQERKLRTYSEQGVRGILFTFAREIGCEWTDERLNRFIDSVFDFD